MKKIVLTLMVVSTTALAGDPAWRNPEFVFDNSKNFTNKTTVTIRPVADVTKACEAESKRRGNGGFGFNVQGCSFWENNQGVHSCTIIVPNKTTMHNLGHEMLHCIQGNYH
jgi:hypothetical protein